MEHPGDDPSKCEKVDVDAVNFHLLVNFIQIDLGVLLKQKAEVFDARISVCLLQAKLIAIKQPIHKDHS